MTEEKTNDAVRHFKAFLRKNPEIVAYVREHDLKWGKVFDDWVIFGESNDIWKTYGVTPEKKEEKNNEPPFSWKKILKTVDNIDAKQWQDRLNTLSGALSGIQSLIGQFRQTGGQNGQNEGGREQNPGGNHETQQSPGNTGDQPPFFFRRD
ncbi:hypothetical protein E4665_00460 [Sporolactobacillus shoreae]|uniref:Cytosolic protein n=1 Tax=Sporolactobacillus shoreae TaxID=1465501 RepID=A0A4Z0GS01_9BACL|nr:spore coat protein YlbD [Sporolactobacillus shoreae]TGB00184.1 hypothetical protein E4665_00460 [Sporolactobacillus shoreae]